jgi:hypothetical protein
VLGTLGPQWSGGPKLRVGTSFKASGVHRRAMGWRLLESQSTVALNLFRRQTGSRKSALAEARIFHAPPHSVSMHVCIRLRLPIVSLAPPMCLASCSACRSVGLSVFLPLSLSASLSFASFFGFVLSQLLSLLVFRLFSPSHRLCHSGPLRIDLFALTYTGETERFV